MHEEATPMQPQHTNIYQYTKTGHREYDVYLTIAGEGMTRVGRVAWTDGTGRPYTRGWISTPSRDPYPNQTRYRQKHGLPDSTTTTREEAAHYCASCWFTVRDNEREVQP